MYIGRTHYWLSHVPVKNKPTLLEWTQGAADSWIFRHSHGKLSRSPRKILTSRAFILLEGSFSKKIDALNSQTCMSGYGDGLLKHIPLGHSKGLKKKVTGRKK